MPISRSMGARVVCVSVPTIDMSAPGPGGEAMDVTRPTRLAASIRPSDPETNGKPAAPSNHSSPPEQTSPNSSSGVNMPGPPPAAAAAAVHQPKIVQTAFTYKLYNMLEDSSIQHLISWSANAESFVMSPSADFSKVLSQYFKHTNISSFVRQLNMYGFHKHDVFHTGNPDTTLWEFKHGNGNFKRGDLMGLREIKRRASRHALVHRESNFNKPSPSHHGPPPEPAHMAAESAEARLANLEHSLYDVCARLQRTEENAHFVNIKNQAVMENMSRLLQLSQDLSQAVLSLVPVDSPVQRDAILSLQGEMHRQADVLRTFDETHEGPYGGRQQYLGTVENAPVSPRQLAQDDCRRSANLTVLQRRGQPLYRPTVPSSVLASPRRPYGSIGGITTPQSSPLRNANPAPPSGPHPLSNVEPPPGSLARRHTAADICAHGWQPAPSPFSASNPPSGPWPSSPSRVAPDDQRIRDSLSTYSLQAELHQHPHSRPATPPPPAHGTNGGSNGNDTFGGWSWNSAANRDTKSLAVRGSSAPPTRRGSMAHILNPSDTAERSDEDEDPRGDDRKRKRLQ